MIAFLVMLNPFALFLYLQPVMQELTQKDFVKVMLKATGISYGMYILFLLAGNFLFERIFQIHFESFRIFGGIIIFSFAYLFIIKGEKAFLHMKSTLDDLASEIALPFMVGAGTISLTILMSQEYRLHIAGIALVIVLSANYLIIMLMKTLREHLHMESLRVAFDKNMDLLLRLNGFFLGAIGINMVIAGISNIYF